MQFNAVYPLDIRLLDPSIDGNPVADGLPPCPHLELVHALQWIAGEPIKAKAVFGDGQSFVFRNSKTEQFIAHIPIPCTMVGPGLANTIINKSKCHIYFHNPKILIEEKHAAMDFPLLAPSLHCAEIKLPIPRCLFGLAAKAKSAKALEAAAKGKVKRIQEAKEAFDAAKSAYEKATDLRKLGLAAVLGGESWRTFADWSKAATALDNAKRALEKEEQSDPASDPHAATKQAQELKKMRSDESREAMHAREERSARAMQQSYEKEVRYHSGQKQEHEKAAKRHDEASQEHDRAAQEHLNSAKEREAQAAAERDRSNQAAKRYADARRQQEQHLSHAQQAQEHANRAEQTAAKAEKLRNDHDLDARTARQVGEFERDAGKPIAAAGERADALAHQEAANRAAEQRDKALNQADAHRKNVAQQHKESARAQQDAQDAALASNEHHERAQDHQEAADSSKQQARIAQDKAEMARRERESALTRAQESEARVDRAKTGRAAAKERAETAAANRKEEKKARKAKEKAMSKSLSPSCSILLPSILSLIASMGLHTVKFSMSWSDLGKIWLKVLAIIAADIVDGYLGFVFDSLKTIAGEGTAAWVMETAGGAMKGIAGGSLRSWGTTDKITLKVPVKVGEAFSVGTTLEFTYDPATGEQVLKSTSSVAVTANAKKPNEKKLELTGSVSQSSLGTYTESGSLSASTPRNSLSTGRTYVEKPDGTTILSDQISGKHTSPFSSGELQITDTTTTPPKGPKTLKEVNKLKAKVGDMPLDMLDLETTTPIL